LKRRRSGESVRRAPKSLEIASFKRLRWDAARSQDVFEYVGLDLATPRREERRVSLGQVRQDSIFRPFVRVKIRRPFARRDGRLEILTNGWRRQAFLRRRANFPSSVAKGAFGACRAKRPVVFCRRFGEIGKILRAVASGLFVFEKRVPERERVERRGAFRRFVFRKIETIFFRVSTVERLSLSRRIYIKRRRTRRFLIFLYSFGERRFLSERAETPKRSFLI